MTPLSDKTTEERPIYRVMLSPAALAKTPGAEGDAKPGRLAHWLGLDVYGRSLLNRVGVLEMRFMSYLLVIITLFELGAWTLLFNAIFQSELLKFGWGTLLAVLPASLFASAVLIYERQFVTTDLSAGFFRLIVPVGMRLLIILASALITAQPVELLIFRGQIMQRVHEEGIRREVVTRLEQYRKAEESERRSLDELREIETGDLVLREDRILQDLSQKRQGQRDRATELRKEEDRAQRNVNYWYGIRDQRRDAVSEARRRGEPADEIVNLDRAVSEAQANLNAWVARRDKAKDELALVEQRILDYTTDLGKAENDFDEQRTLARQRRQVEIGAAERSQERLAEWINQLRNVQPAPGEEVVENVAETDSALQTQNSPPPLAAEPSTADPGEELAPAESDPSAAPAEDPVDTTRRAAREAQENEARKPFRYTLPQYDFFEQLRVLRDLRFGYPPRWQGVGEERAKELADLYSLVDVRPCPDQVPEGETGPRAASEGDCDPVLWERHKAQAEQFNWSFRIVFVIALVIPLLVIASKLLMSKELKSYYSSQIQASKGNPGALALNKAGLPRKSILSSLMGSEDAESER